MVQECWNLKALPQGTHLFKKATLSSSSQTILESKFHVYEPVEVILMISKRPVVTGLLHLSFIFGQADQMSFPHPLPLFFLFSWHIGQVAKPTQLELLELRIIFILKFKFYNKLK